MVNEPRVGQNPSCWLATGLYLIPGVAVSTLHSLNIVSPPFLFSSHGIFLSHLNLISAPLVQWFANLPAYGTLSFLFLCHAVWPEGPQFPDQGLNPRPLQWKCGALTTGLPGKALGKLLKLTPWGSISDLVNQNLLERVPRAFKCLLSSLSDFGCWVSQSLETVALFCPLL